MSENIRRLPVYLVLDCSVSMVGEGIDAVRQGLASLMSELSQDPHALETAWLSVITFSSSAEQIVPLTDLTKFQMPRLKIRPGTKFGAALTLLHDSIKREVLPNTPTQKGDWLPLVFLLTDGEPTDEWEKSAQKLHTLFPGKSLNLIAFGCGPDVNTDILYRLTDAVYLLKEYSFDNFKKLLKWITASISTASQKIELSRSKLILADFPKDLLEKASKDHEKRMSRHKQTQLFLAILCSQTKDCYLIRYHLNDDGTGYNPIRVHKVDKEYLNESLPDDDATQISSEELHGILPCPYCNNNMIAKCPCCGKMLCCSDERKTVQCPACNTQLTFSSSPDPAKIEIKSSHG